MMFSSHEIYGKLYMNTRIIREGNCVAERKFLAMDNKNSNKRIWQKIFRLLPPRQKLRFLWILAILVFSAVLSQLTPLAVGYLTDHILADQSVTFPSVLPVLLMILLVNVANEIIKVARRLIVEDTATQAEKTARQRTSASLLTAPLSYFRNSMTGNIHGRLNRSLEGTVKLIKLLFMDFAPAVTTGLAAIVTIFLRLPVPVACLVVLVIPVGTFLVFRQISPQKGIRSWRSAPTWTARWLNFWAGSRQSERSTARRRRKIASSTAPSIFGRKKCAITRRWHSTTA